jgi:hypothetical protein
MPRPPGVTRPAAVTVAGQPPAASPPAGVVPVVHVAMAPPVVTTGFAVPVVPAANPQLSLAMAQMQAAQAGCAQADAYQNYVSGVVNAQKTTDQNIAQTLQTLAANTSDPDLQNALLSAAGQSDPINDALQQQLQSMAGTYEGICQARMAAAQANLTQALGAQPAATTASAGASASAGQGSTGAPAQPASAVAAGTPVATPVAATVQVSGAVVPAQPQSPPANTACSPVSATNMPAPQAPWGAWANLGSTGLVFDVSRVNDTTLTWRFLNAGSNTISSMQFNYTYIDAATGQQATLSDVLPYALSPGQSVGGWAAYTANTRGNVSVAVTQMACSNPGVMMQAQR